MKQPLITFNRGVISPLSLARVDNERVSLTAETMVNWVPRVLGPMSLRPGTQYLGVSASNNTTKHLKFIFSLSDTAILELTDTLMRVWISDSLVERSSVSSSVTNGNFTSDIASWTDNSEDGATASWETGGYLELWGDGDAAAIVDQTITVAAGDQNVEHALAISIHRGPVVLRVGSTSGGDEYIEEIVLETGHHNLAFTPTGNFYIRFLNRKERQVFVDSCNVGSSGTMTLTTPWSESDLDNLRYDQSGNFIFVACKDVHPYVIRRSATNSWSVERYAFENGPYMVVNTDESLKIDPTVNKGAGNISTARSFFRSGHVGALFRLTSEGQAASRNIVAEDRWSHPIKVTGVGQQRKITVSITGTITTTTVRLQRSIDVESGSWADVEGASWTSTISTTYTDNLLDNQVVWYRIGTKSGEYTATDDFTPTIIIGHGMRSGVVRVVSFSNSTVVLVEGLSKLGSGNETWIWEESLWSGYRGYPTSVGFHDGRLWWAGKDKIVGSVSDDFWNFDPDTVGDSGPINRTLGKGPVDNLTWILSLQRLIVGGEMAEYSVRASSDDGPLTPTEFTPKDGSTQGSHNIQAIRVDHDGIYVHRNQEKVYRITREGSNDYYSQELTVLVPEYGAPGIIRIDVQRQPDTRIHCVRSDGTVMIGLFDPVENALAWYELSTDGIVEDVIIMPGSKEDRVYYSINRTINSSTVRYLEKVALETECRGGTLNKQADSFITVGPGTTITGLSHLEGESVVVWADGEDVGTESDYTQTYTVSGGQITLSSSITTGIVGLPYTAQWKSSKLGGGMRALMEKTRISKVGLLMRWAHKKGLRFGPDFTNLDDLPEIEQGKTVTDEVTTDYSEQEHVFPGVWRVDTRLCLQAQAPRPVTILAAIPDV